MLRIENLTKIYGEHKAVTICRCTLHRAKYMAL